MMFMSHVSIETTLVDSLARFSYLLCYEIVQIVRRRKIELKCLSEGTKAHSKQPLKPFLRRELYELSKRYYYAAHNSPKVSAQSLQQLILINVINYWDFVQHQATAANGWDCESYWFYRVIFDWTWMQQNAICWFMTYLVID
ncbi:CLUMA_CG015729, isoform A [Clunio marinus]|uniref:CLUMA_CG015729, isoform A n=1 Tax=Clunio marinus TaxID=568069 RepID=A0A1J1IQ53_9DIPT|nr:CLUMA_CG015729, isoform A [Clunio marinus]